MLYGQSIWCSNPAALWLLKLHVVSSGTLCLSPLCWKLKLTCRVHTRLRLWFTCDGLVSYPSGNQWLSSTARDCSCDPQVHVVSIIWTLYMYLELERYDCVQPDRLSIKVHVQINSIYRCRIRVLSNFKKNRSK